MPFPWNAQKKFFRPILRHCENMTVLAIFSTSLTSNQGSVEAGTDALNLIEAICEIFLESFSRLFFAVSGQKTVLHFIRALTSQLGSYMMRIFSLLGEF